MTTPGFDKSYYLNSKLTALKEQYSEWGNKDAAFLESLLAGTFGLTAERHYHLYGYKEGLEPNAFFNHEEYRFAKAESLFKAGKFDSMETALAGFDKAWPEDTYLHYIQFGAAEGVNPSNHFDESRYMADKLAALQSNGATNVAWAGKSIDNLRTFFADAGMTALDHYINYGIREGLTPAGVPANEQVDPADTPWKLPHDNVNIPPSLHLTWANNLEISTAPNSAIGQVTMTTKDQISMGTGFLISPEHVLTSAHVLLDHEGNFDSSADLKFFPALNGDVSTADSYDSGRVWIQKTFPTPELYSTWPDDDLAIIHLNTAIGNDQGYLSPLLYEQIDLTDITIESSGYPAGGIEQDNPATPCQDYYQWQVSGSVVDSIYNNGAIEMTNDMISAPGASGSPIIYTQNNEYFAIGVYSGILDDATPAAAAMDVDSYNWLIGILQQDGFYLDC